MRCAEAATTALQLNKEAGQGPASPAAKPIDVQALMKSDPRFISRLIQQLDSQMHNMQDEKRRRQQAIKDDTEEMLRIDKEISISSQDSLSVLSPFSVKQSSQ